LRECRKNVYEVGGHGQSHFERSLHYKYSNRERYFALILRLRSQTISISISFPRSDFFPFSSYSRHHFSIVRLQHLMYHDKRAQQLRYPPKSELNVWPGYQDVSPGMEEYFFIRDCICDHDVKGRITWVYNLGLRIYTFKGNVRRK
jgi:hypothetical protein